MNFTLFFVDRPIFATVLSTLIFLVGAIAFLGLPVAQYPDVVPPTIVVRANYPGADAATVAETVATPIEQEVNGVERMLYMSSQSTDDGSMTLTVTFSVGTDLDIAQVLVQNRVAIAAPRLPEPVRALGITTAKSSPDLLLVVHLFSRDGTFDQLYISNYALLQIRDVLSRLDGVGSVQAFGLREYSMRIWLQPERMALLGITTGDVTRALRAQNVQVAAGVLGQEPAPAGQQTQITIRAKGRLREPEEFADVIVKAAAQGRLVRIGDVGRVELGAQSYVNNSYLNGAQAVALAIAQRPGTNALAAAQAIRDTMAALSRDFPKGLEFTVAYDPTVFVAESIDAVYHTIGEAVLLVVLVILVFLHSLRATLIPVLSIPVSLVGTLAFMAWFGFSLNVLSLFGLVLAIGIVVDDAIVVVENVERHMRAGLSPKDAARAAMREVAAAVVAIALVLSAVFLPTLFLTGISGRFYQQFALTIAVATLISMLNSLTLSPALAALLLRPHAAAGPTGSRWRRAVTWPGRVLASGFERAFGKVEHAYAAAVSRVLRVRHLALLVYVALLGLTVYAFRATPTGFIPIRIRAT